MDEQVGVIFIAQDGFENAIYFGVDLMLHGEILARAVLHEHGRNTGLGRGWHGGSVPCGQKKPPQVLVEMGRFSRLL
jgi:hypothetical protein